jgi:hypothetical protein
LNLDYVIKDTEFLKICKMLSNDSKSTVRQFFRNRTPFQNIETVEENNEINPGLLFNNNLDFLINEFSLDLKNFYPSTKIEFKSENFIIENLNKDFSSEKDSLLKSESLELEKNENSKINLVEQTELNSEILDHSLEKNNNYQELENKEESSFSSSLIENVNLDESLHSERSKLIDDQEEHSIN